jgi:divalent metal cation (Fe/Co/Zn/Cd) transporter
MLIKASLDIVKPAFNQIVDARAKRNLPEFLKEIKNSDERIFNFHKIRSRASGSAIFVDLHMLVEPNMSVKEAHDITLVVEKSLRKQYPEIIDITIHVEPNE